MKYLLCELNAENYTMPIFNIFDTKEEAIKEALFVCANHFNGDDTDISVENDLSRITVVDEEDFYVTEILEFDENKGDHLLVWHHAYHGVDFEIRFQGTFFECDDERIEQIQRVFDEYAYEEDNEDFDEFDLDDLGPKDIAYKDSTEDILKFLSERIGGRKND